MSKKAAFYTLGCKVNQYETEALHNLFRCKNYEIVDFSHKADVYVVNTCTVTHLSDRKSRQMIRRAMKRNPQGIVAVTGCYAQVASEEIQKIPGVDIIIGTHNREQIVDLIEKAEKENDPVVLVEELGNASFEELPLGEIRRTRAFIKVEDGCEHFCSYCLVPYARGPVRSRKMENIIAEVERMASFGTKEIVLTGVNLGAYGNELEEYISLADVITKTEGIKGIERIRLSSLELTDFTMELMETIADSNKVCEHLHIPLQSGDDYVLNKMNRLYTTSEYRKLVNYLRYIMPDLALTTDVMVGFPGEKDKNFNNTYEFVREMAFSRTHVFKYSSRAGTPAREFSQHVSPEDKEQRSRNISRLGQNLAQEYSKQFIQQQVKVLFEEEKQEGFMEGLTQHYLRVRAKACPSLKGQIRSVKVIELNSGFLSGDLL